MRAEPRMKLRCNTDGVTAQRELRMETARRTGRAKLPLSPIFSRPSRSIRGRRI